MVCLMIPGPHDQDRMGADTSATYRTPPRWSPDLERSYPFRQWVYDVFLWCCMTDLQPHQQCAAIIMRLGGQARELARRMTAQQVFNGGEVNGVH